MADKKPNLQIHKIPQSNYIDSLKWLPNYTAFDKYAVISLYNTTSSTSSIEIHSFQNPNSQTDTPISSITSQSRVSSLKTSKTLIAYSTLSGSLNFVSLGFDSGRVSFDKSLSVEDEGFHVGSIVGVDLLERECVSVGEDGRVNLVNLGGGGDVGFRRVYDSNGLVSYSTVKWGSPMEFVTGGLGFSLQWWDLRRKNGEPSLYFKGNWSQQYSAGIVHSIDIHPSRKHTCLAGGSAGTVFAWDLRWPQQPIILSGVGCGEKQAHTVSESEVWEVQFDCHLQPSNMASASSSRMLPVMMCSEDGILAVLEQGAEPVELLEEACAINSFDIDKQNYSDIICSLEWESIAILSRS